MTDTSFSRLKDPEIKLRILLNERGHICISQVVNMFPLVDFSVNDFESSNLKEGPAQ